ncbi:DUF4097 family beta strand repeat-containing protein [Streptomyces xanthophaeus]|uniref:DUF4097 family beta strand repeat-containing protein n=1 Tax=Streptomyces xanthophaeus TaxID=67385 RepID=UPI0026493A2F|nr:DUF4097 family beta strand repeat-containing protein [Streptomyces xanthophaeus]WKD32131.1 DUF4097 domain-containing protein [Streptomyces xanthophaeus]
MRKPLAFTALALTLAAPLLTGCGGMIGPEHTAEDSLRPTGPVHTIDIASGSGTVKVVPGDSVDVRRTVRYNGDGPGGLKEPAEGVLTLGNCSRCSTDYTVTAPAGTALDVRAGSGDVSITGFTGVVTVQTDSGDIDADGLRGNTSLKAGSGSVEATFGALVRTIAAEAGSGDVRLVLPDGKYRVDADTGSGGRDVRVRQDDAADHSVRVRTGSGDIVVTAGP